MKMNEETIGYTVINKDGKVVEDVKFNDYDKLADHMLEMAEKWYTGEYSEDDKLEISAFDETGEIIYSDVATFGESKNDISDAFNITPEGIPIWGEFGTNS
jgi:hypothetical protein